MTSEPVILTPDATVAEALARIREPQLSPAVAAQVFVARAPMATPTGRYLGMVHFQRLLREPPADLLGGIVDNDIDPLRPDHPAAGDHPPDGHLRPGRDAGGRPAATGWSARSPSTTCWTTRCPGTGGTGTPGTAATRRAHRRGRAGGRRHRWLTSAGPTGWTSRASPGGVKLPRFDPEAFGRWSEGIARCMGTAKFIVYMTVVIALWFGWNTLAPADLRFDPYTFTFLTLVLSLQASYAAPLILLAQNRQADRDRLALEEDRRRAAMQKADTEYLAREIAALRIALGEVATRDFLRSELARLAEELDEAAQRRQKLEPGSQERAVGRSGGGEGRSGGGEPPLDEPRDDLDGDYVRDGRRPKG